MCELEAGFCAKYEPPMISAAVRRGEARYAESIDGGLEFGLYLVRGRSRSVLANGVPLV